jgi:hydrogenase maturation protein HypF
MVNISSVFSVRRVRIEIHGAVQGVGFRPFVYRLANELALTGWVINDAQGVFIEIEGLAPALERFLERLPAEVPPLAIVKSLESNWLEPAGYERFEIRHSDDQGIKTALVLPDVATCSACLSEVLNPTDRRHRYPFTNCTNCGPRFSILVSLPYDRPNTSMRRFTMCQNCQAEYDSPLDRRFHAQPNACPVCGPRLAVWERTNSDDPDRHGCQTTQVAATKTRSSLWTATAETDRALSRAADALRAGWIVAVKGLGGFHLMVDAGNEAALRRLRERKPRRAKPFAIMARDAAQARTLCEMSLQAEALLTAPAAPIVLLRRRSDAPIAESVAPDNPNVGIMLPYTPLHHVLLRELDFPVVATSGNLTDEPICTDEHEALQRLGDIADLFLVHDRPIVRHVDDSVAWIVQAKPRLLRRARGYAPLPVSLSHPVPPILAVGGHLKNTVALSVGNQVFISQHIGDLETPEAMAAFERVIADFLRLYEASPVAIAHDLHPDYLSTKWATGTEQAIRNTIGVQHHHAHLAACLAENGVAGPALGIIWDGAGYGADGTIWGGEFLLGGADSFTRAAHLYPFRLPGGDAAVHEPRRAALGLLWEIYGEDVLDRDDLAPIRAFQPAVRRLLGQMLRQGVNCPITTSAGRLFDGIAALLGLHQQTSFEGQAAMALEFIADESENGAYPLEFHNVMQTGNSTHSGEALDEQKAFAIPSADSPALPLVLDWRPLVETVLADLRVGIKPGIVAARFHNALVQASVSMAQITGEPFVALSGGCFQNRLLTERAAELLRRVGFQVLLHSQVPPNDGGISLGQVAVAAARLAHENNAD